MSLLIGIKLICAHGIPLPISLEVVNQVHLIAKMNPTRLKFFDRNDLQYGDDTGFPKDYSSYDPNKPSCPVITSPTPDVGVYEGISYPIMEVQDKTEVPDKKVSDENTGVSFENTGVAQEA